MFHATRTRLTSVLVLSFAILAVPIFASLMFPSIPYCGISMSHAQDNPCLAQDATISAQEVTILQSQATITALEAEIVTLQSQGGNPSQGGIATPVVGLPFIETFENNANGWALPQRVTFADGGLQITDNWTVIPLGANPLGNISIQVDINTNWSAYIGLLSNSDSVEEWHQVEFDRDDGGNIDIFYSNDFTSNDIPKWRVSNVSYNIPSSSFTARVDIRGNQLEIYVDGQLAAITQISHNTDIIRLGHDDTSNATFDNLEIRPLQ